MRTEAVCFIFKYYGTCALQSRARLRQSRAQALSLAGPSGVYRVQNLALQSVEHVQPGPVASQHMPCVCLSAPGVKGGAGAVAGGPDGRVPRVEPALQVLERVQPGPPGARAAGLGPRRGRARCGAGRAEERAPVQPVQPAAGQPAGVAVRAGAPFHVMAFNKASTASCRPARRSQSAHARPATLLAHTSCWLVKGQGHALWHERPWKKTHARNVFCPHAVLVAPHRLRSASTFWHRSCAPSCDMPCHPCDMLRRVYRKRCWRLSRQSRLQSGILHLRACAWAIGRPASAGRPS